MATSKTAGAAAAAEAAAAAGRAAASARGGARSNTVATGAGWQPKPNGRPTADGSLLAVARPTVLCAVGVMGRLTAGSAMGAAAAPGTAVTIATGAEARIATVSMVGEVMTGSTVWGEGGEVGRACGRCVRGRSRWVVQVGCWVSRQCQPTWGGDGMWLV